MVLLEFLRLILIKTISFRLRANVNILRIYIIIVLAVCEASIGMALMAIFSRSRTLNSAVL